MKNIHILPVLSFLLTSTVALAEHCEVKLPDSSVYSGNCDNGLFNGYGTLTWRSGAIYEGSFKDGLINGKGKFTHPEGWYREGDFVNGE